MSCFCSECPAAGSRRSCGQSCQPCGDCPYASPQLLCYAAYRGQASAQRLTAEADRLLSAISCADDICRFLGGDAVLELTLSRALSSELALIDTLFAQTVRNCPRLLNGTI